MTYASRNRRCYQRLPGRDYGQAATYFVTICTFERIYWFGTVERQQMILNPFGQFAHDLWFDLPRRWPHVSLGAFQVMPNHVHGVLTIGRPDSTTWLIPSLSGTISIPTQTGAAARAAPTQPFSKNSGGMQVGATLAVAPDVADRAASFNQFQWATRPTLGQIIGAYKSMVAKACLEQHLQDYPDVHLGKIWQRTYHETEITQHWVLDHVTRYICRNPANWAADILRQVPSGI